MHERLARCLKALFPCVTWLLASEGIGLVLSNLDSLPSPMDFRVDWLGESASGFVVFFLLLVGSTAAGPRTGLVVLELMREAPSAMDVTPGLFDALMAIARTASILEHVASPIPIIGRALLLLLS